jgi:hypothetical protein
MTARNPVELQSFHILGMTNDWWIPLGILKQSMLDRNFFTRSSDHVEKHLTNFVQSSYEDG